MFFQFAWVERIGDFSSDAVSSILQWILTRRSSCCVVGLNSPVHHAMAAGRSSDRVVPWPQAELDLAHTPHHGNAGKLVASCCALPPDGAHTSRHGAELTCVPCYCRRTTSHRVASWLPGWARLLACLCGDGWSYCRPTGRQVEGAREGKGGRCPIECRGGDVARLGEIK
jgi:hypothetical protein